ncbi:MAG: RagB/SusD family nutrient uptake outer membrane protein, partial [Bacteroidota bacterium]|nr:RagB/SusD family nutrient uptake outer membrane protein [Bacteroidota bacterium]
MKLFNIKAMVLLASSALTFTSCFNLDEEVFSEVTESTFVPTEQDVASLMASAYNPLTYIMDW